MKNLRLIWLVEVDYNGFVSRHDRSEEKNHNFSTAMVIFEVHPSRLRHLRLQNGEVFSVTLRCGRLELRHRRTCRRKTFVNKDSDLECENANRVPWLDSQVTSFNSQSAQQIELFVWSWGRPLADNSGLLLRYTLWAGPKRAWATM